MKTNSKECVILPLSKTAEFLHPPLSKCLSVDWLQLDMRGLLQNSALYQKVTKEFHTRHFQQITEIFKGAFRIATVAHTPLSEILPPELNLVKMENRELYYNQPVTRLLQCGESFSLSYKSVSRLDLCIDFHEFNNKLSPVQFIRNFLNNKYRKVGANQFTCIGQQLNTMEYSYIRFSKKTSNISVYLYNKSKEMREVKKKNYIVSKWKKSGLDISRDIWRLEFSIHNAKFDFFDKITGVLEPFTLPMLDRPEYLDLCIATLLNKYFCFYLNTNTRKENCKTRLELFDTDYTHLDIKFRDESKSTNRSDIIFLNSLRGLNNELRSINRGEAEYTKALIKYYKTTRKL